MIYKNFLLLPLILWLFSSCASQKNGSLSGLQPYKIVYNVLENRDNDDYELYSMEADGSAKKNITRNSDVAWTYYAYHDKLYFISDRDTCARCYFLYESDADGNHLRKVSNLRLEDSWMSSRNNGHEMVVAGRIGKEIRYQLFLIDLANGQFKQLTRDTSAYFADPCFSPDGKQIVYRHRKNRRNRNEKAELWLMDVAGNTTTRQLTTFPPSDTTAPWHSYHAGPPHWNAQAGYISYQTIRNGKYEIHAVKPDGTNLGKLFDSTMDTGWHSWSPDGNWLVMDIYNDDRMKYDIGLWNRKSKAFRLIADSPKYEQAPVFVRKKQ